MLDTLLLLVFCLNFKISTSLVRGKKTIHIGKHSKTRIDKISELQTTAALIYACPWVLLSKQRDRQTDGRNSFFKHFIHLF